MIHHYRPRNGPVFLDWLFEHQRTEKGPLKLGREGLETPTEIVHVLDRKADRDALSQSLVIREEHDVLADGLGKLPPEDGWGVASHLANAGADPNSAAALRKYAEVTVLPRIRGAHMNLFIGCVSLIEHGVPVTVYLSNHWSQEDFFTANVHIRDWRSYLGSVFDGSSRCQDLIEIRRHRLFRNRIERVIQFIHDDSKLSVCPRRPNVSATERKQVLGAQPGLPVVESASTEVLPQRVSREAEESIANSVHSLDLIEEKFARPTAAKMSESVATIQAEQGVALRAPTNSPVVINGGPGTGKTLVGLHRVAYVMYQLRQSGKSPSCLVIAPTDEFLQYINQVVVELHESEVRQESLVSLLFDAPEFPILESRSPDGISRLKGDLLMVEVLRRFVASTFRAKTFEVKNRYGLSQVQGNYLHDLIREAQRLLVEESWTVVSVRSWLTGRLVEMGRSLVPRDESASQNGRDHKRAVEITDDPEVNAKEMARIATRMIPRISASKLLSDFVFGDDRPGDDEDGVLSAVLLATRRRSGSKVVFHREDGALLDELKFILGDRIERSDHVMLDEAQELSPMEWRAISRRVTGDSLTVLGDMSQQFALGAPRSWKQAMEYAGLPEPMINYLKISYRVPKPILEAAKWCIKDHDFDRSLKGIRGGLKPIRVESDSTIDRRVVARMRRMTGGIHLGLGDVTSSSEHDRFLVVTTDPALLKLNGVSKTMFAKDPLSLHGVEYDHVVLVEPADWAEDNEFGQRLLYVALTRATKTVSVVHSRPLPRAMEGIDFDEKRIEDLPEV